MSLRKSEERLLNHSQMDSYSCNKKKKKRKRKKKKKKKKKILEKGKRFDRFADSVARR